MSYYVTLRSQVAIVGSEQECLDYVYALFKKFLELTPDKKMEYDYIDLNDPLDSLTQEYLTRDFLEYECNGRFDTLPCGVEIPICDITAWHF